jgi:hypothetical protein
VSYFLLALVSDLAMNDDLDDFLIVQAVGLLFRAGEVLRGTARPAGSLGR